jgi:hypothetical protein
MSFSVCKKCGKIQSDTLGLFDKFLCIVCDVRSRTRTANKCSRCELNTIMGSCFCYDHEEEFQHDIGVDASGAIRNDEV